MRADNAAQCASCGFMFTAQRPWLAEYHAISIAPSGARISDTPVRHRHKKPRKNAPNTTHLIHTNCWRRLVSHFSPDQLSLDRLYEVLKDLPYFASNPGEAETHLSYIDPHRLPDLKLETENALPTPSPEVQDSMSRASADDRFAQLPVEMRLEIATHLSTSDYLTLRYCSRAMAAVFDIEAFWRTRFLVHEERGFVSYLFDDYPAEHRWRLLYHHTNLNKYIDYINHLNHVNPVYCENCVNNVYCVGHTDRVNQPSHCFQAMRRHWRINTNIYDRYYMTQQTSTVGLEMARKKGPLRWKKVFDDKYICERQKVYGNNRKACHRCLEKHIYFKEKASFSSSVVQITFFVLFEGEDTYIAGLKLIHEDSTGAPNIQLGYRIPGKQVTINLSPQQKLRGFILNTSAHGVHAIRSVTTAGELDWIGQPVGIVGKEMGIVGLEMGKKALTTNRPIRALLGTFDHCRMTGFEIGIARNGVRQRGGE
ncbi:hypothetical protein ASPZODRAFT_561105 [Penicilliopsis zonata CBS 506.65]|uniref:F-box domain-containing protein n=1 Tax=Penicilliopsis zonata CBS 506.65 TaxID=1073090 RepID=A0A1L9SDQ1_9EURO|nr:hypothetical protein ASPZODRAFT_561105 [Penicilliopsis zonata CBS 506.65]OJJ45268.1 hypothetical protein ASPZODRAFT_561105 [Penicilliopsis zonata CBS 506.65]